MPVAPKAMWVASCLATLDPSRLVGRSQFKPGSLATGSTTGGLPPGVHKLQPTGLGTPWPTKRFTKSLCSIWVVTPTCSSLPPYPHDVYNPEAEGFTRWKGLFASFCKGGMCQVPDVVQGGSGSPGSPSQHLHPPPVSRERCVRLPVMPAALFSAAAAPCHGAGC